MLKKNLIANYIGQGWVALMGLAFIPLYIKYLGIEAYGLIGVFALLSTWLSLFNMGMTPSLSREMARFTGGSHSAQSIRDLLRTIEIIAVGIALFIAAGVMQGSKWIASSWLTTETLPVDVVAQAFSLMGVVVALRFVESIYRSSIVGLQREVLFNIVNSALATIRGVGAVAILAWVSPTIHAFFLWQGFLSIVTLAILATVTYASLPKTGRITRFSLDALRSIWRFAGGMLGITLLSLMLTQIDKLLLSKLLNLSDFGYYTLAATVAGMLFMLITPITQAIYPRLCELYSRKDEAGIADVYHQGAQLVTVLAGSVAIVMIFFSENFMRLWTQQPELAGRTAPLLSLLMFGNLLNGVVHMPYHAQLAHGWTGLSVKVNVVAVLVIVPTILWVTPRYGAEGAACAWIALNMGYVLIGTHLMHRRILGSEKWRWYTHDLIVPLSAGTAAAVVLKLTWPSADTVIAQLLLLTVATILTSTASLVAAGQLRRQLLQAIQSLLEIDHEHTDGRTN